MAYTHTEYFEVNQHGAILELIINRPNERNPISFAMEDELDKLLNQAADDDSVRVVTLKGAGKMFSAGHDLKEVAQGYIDHGKPSGLDPHKVPQLRGMWYFPKLLIAAVHEYVGPIAQDLIAHCDFVIAAEGTRFSFEQAKSGSGVIRWSPLVFMFPMRVYKKMMLGGWFTAEQALKWDFVQRVVPLEELDSTLRAWAEEMATIAPEQTRAMRAGIHRQYELMGLANMALVQNNFTGHGSENDREFFRIVLEKGVREAVKFRQVEANDSITQI